jgi:ribosome biogenesis GTPase / thiamine phosphate phosphatase
VSRDKSHSINSVTSSSGIVYKKNLGLYAVHTGDRILSCALSSRMRKELGSFKTDRESNGRGKRQVKVNDDTDPIAIGDHVEFIDARDGTGMIVSVLPRRNQLSRRTAVPMPSARSFEQVIAANVDQVMPVFSAAQPPPKWNLLDRYLVAAEAAGIPASICISKIDLLGDEEEFHQTVQEYRDIGYFVFLTSVITGEGLGELKKELQGRFSVFLGKSGVGKTSLLNAIQGLELRVNEVNRVSGKGKHTTSHLEMYPLDFGGIVADTPGVREFGFWDVHEDDLAGFFPEMRPFLGLCKFGLDCQHVEEPGCAIRQAVGDSRIPPRRYRSYLRLLGEDLY